MRKLTAMAIALLLILTVTVAGTAATAAQAGKAVGASSYRLTVWRTGYTLRGHTRTGTYTHWGSVAVDPSVIPLGSRMYVPGYGTARAEDTGGAVIGRHIDVWVPTTALAYRMTGWVTITVYRR